MCKQYFYLRISTQTRNETEKEKEQTFERQVGILQRAGYKLTNDNTFAERISGKTKANEREQFEKLLNVLEENDWCIFCETSRFSRNYIQGMQMLDTLIFDKKVNVKFVSNGIELYANTRFNPYTWYTVSQMLLSDELQRRVISFNTINGLKAKKEQGVVLGAPKKDIPQFRIAEVMSMHKNGYSVLKIAGYTGLSRRLVERILKENGGK